MKILNAREGFACNSSSTHSIVFSDRRYTDRAIQDGDFGWQHFVASSADAKALWIALSLKQNLLHQMKMDEGTARLIVESIAGVWPESGYVDHQSLITFPRSWHGGSLNLDFARDFTKYVLSPGVVIYGGNDNEEETWAPSGERILYREVLPVDQCSTDNQRTWVARKDSSGYWTLFNRASGNKVRVAFDPGHLEVEAQKAAAPELVDLKITDFCTYDCPACYQGSTRDGKHASYGSVLVVLDALGEAEVFEVAIGGGEPTLHPNFQDLIEAANNRSIVPNFTTRDPRWFVRHPDVVHHIGSVAVSCDSCADVESVVKAIDQLPGRERDFLRRKTVVQHILGIADEWVVQGLLRRCHKEELPAVLLGYKTTHRGANHVPTTPKNGTWGDWLRSFISGGEEVPYRLGVDTVLAAEVKDFVSSRRVTEFEGQFSCFVDAVPDRPLMFASSFGKTDPIECDCSQKNWFVDGWKRVVAYKPESAYLYKKVLTVYNKS